MLTQRKQVHVTQEDKRNDELIALIARCGIKDQRALEALYRRCSAQLNGIAYCIVKDLDHSNEVLQEAFVQIWKNASSYRADISKPMTWMSSIVRYRALDKLELERKHVHLRDTETNADNLNASECSPEDNVYYCEMNTHFNFCLDRLEKNVRESIELAYIHGHSREEIARVQQTKVNTVKSWLHRGAQRLKACLQTKIN